MLLHVYILYTLYVFITKVNPTWTDKIKNQIVLSYSCLPVPSLPLLQITRNNVLNFTIDKIYHKIYNKKKECLT